MVKRLLTLVAFLVLSVGVVLAENKPEKVEIPADVNINGVKVKKGTYNVVLDQQTGEMSIYKGKNVVVKTTGKMQERKQKAVSTELVVVRQDGASVLRSITFEGSDRAFV
ncbi:MAG: hypothetical protein JNN15_12755, partial [Blastocatellia bacterium]|nr:hypothetical protein [Blastocatellia bacterium]